METEIDFEKVLGIGKWVVIEDHSLVEETKSGLVTNLYGVKGDAGRKAEYFHGTVLWAGPKTGVKRGDHVIYDAYNGGADLEANGRELFATHPQNVWGVVEE